MESRLLLTAALAVASASLAFAQTQPAQTQPAASRVLLVGPGKTYAVPSRAIAAARDGDTIQIDTKGTYFNDVASIRANDLTIVGVGGGRALVKTDGRVYGHKGIWVFEQGFKNLTIENIDLQGASLDDAEGGNGAGLCAQGTNLTVRNCKFAHNQDGILGGMGATVIEYSEFAFNSPNNPAGGATHNLYIGDTAGSLVFRFNYSHDTTHGHLLKSRAAVNDISYNRLSDDAGTGSRELDLPNGGQDNVIGNLIVQSAKSQNNEIVAYGEEGIVNPKSWLNFVNNTVVNEARNGIFLGASKLPAGFKLVVKNNIFAGPGTTISSGTIKPIIGGNVITTVAAAMFVDPDHFNFELQATSSAIDAAIPPGTDGFGNPLAPEYEYAHPANRRDRKADKKLDAGAYERS